MRHRIFSSENCADAMVAAAHEDEANDHYGCNAAIEQLRAELARGIEVTLHAEAFLGGRRFDAGSYRVTRIDPPEIDPNEPPF